MSHDIHASVVRIFLCCELVAKFLNMLKNFMQIFSPKYFARLSRDVRASVRNLSQRNFGEFTMRNFPNTRTNVAGRSRDSLAKTSRLSGEKIKHSDTTTNVAGLSYEFK